MKKFIVYFITFLMIFSLCGCRNGGSTDTDESDMAYTRDKGTLVVGITEFKPMDYRSPDDPSNWIGFDADMAKAFARHIGVEAEFIEIDWNNKIMELKAKNIDCVWNGMTLTPEVLNSMSCSRPYFSNSQVVIVRAEDADKYQDEDSLKALKFAVESGSAGEKAAETRNFNITSVQTQADALMETAAGTSDACIVDLLMAKAMIGEGTSYPGLTYTVKLNSEEYGVGFRKGSDMAGKFDEFYAEALKSGQVLEIAEKYGLEEFIIK